MGTGAPSHTRGAVAAGAIAAVVSAGAIAAVVAAGAFAAVCGAGAIAAVSGGSSNGKSSKVFSMTPFMSGVVGKSGSSVPGEVMDEKGSSTSAAASSTTVFLSSIYFYLDYHSMGRMGGGNFV